MPVSFGGFASTIALPDAVRQIPCGAVLHSQSAGQLISRDSFAGFSNQRNGEKPFAEGKVGVMIDSARGSGELEAAVIALIELAVGARLAAFLVRLALCVDPRDPRGFTGETLDAAGPAHTL